MTLEELDAKLHAAMAEVASLNAGGIQIHNKRYTTVAKRVEVFRKHFGVYGRLRIAEETADDKVIRMRALLELREDTAWMEHAEGRAEEQRDASQVNRTSARENCETSAIGRALASFGLHGGEYASANEVENAVHQQTGQPAVGVVLPGGQRSAATGEPLAMRPSGNFGYGKKNYDKPWNVMETRDLEWFLTAERTPPNIREKCSAELKWREHEAAQLDAARAQQAQDDAQAIENEKEVPFD